MPKFGKLRNSAAGEVASYSSVDYIALANSSKGRAFNT
jgi:hypothetical protein